MSAAKKKRGAQAPRPRSGYAREDQRRTKKVTLQLSPAAYDLLHSLATEIGEGDPKRNLSRTVEEALNALNREMTEQDEENEEIMRGATLSPSNPPGKTEP